MTEQFNIKDYLYVKNVLTPIQCTEVVDRIFTAHKQGLTFTDNFKKSDSIGGIYDDLLNEKLEFIQDLVGVQLKPSYSYARIYRPEEIMKAHVDNYQSDFTISITAGFNGEVVWPIWILEREESKPYLKRYTGPYNFVPNGGISIDIQEGDGLLFNRNILHWRIPYVQGIWQVQLFLVYKKYYY